MNKQLISKRLLPGNCFSILNACFNSGIQSCQCVKKVVASNYEKFVPVSPDLINVYFAVISICGNLICKCNFGNNYFGFISDEGFFFSILCGFSFADRYTRSSPKTYLQQIWINAQKVTHAKLYTTRKSV